MKLLFQNSSGEERVIANPTDEKEAYKHMMVFCEEHNFKVYYVRSWMVDGRKCFDVGSWSEFFFLEE